MSSGLNAAVIAVLGLAVLFVLISMLRTRKPVRILVLTMLQGLAAICAVNLLGMLIDIDIALNWYTVSAAMVFGTPGVIGILLLNTMFRT